MRENEGARVMGRRRRDEERVEDSRLTGQGGA